MFRVTQMMRELVAPTPVGPHRDPPGPVVIWNLTRRCNLACRHCYSDSTAQRMPKGPAARRMSKFELTP